jgi:hypothetical protein
LSNKTIGFETSAKQLPIRYTWDRTRGAQTIRSYKGTADQIRALEIQFQFSGWSTSVTQGAVWSLEATWGLDDRNGGQGGEQAIDTWELSANVVEKDLLSTNLPAIKAMVDSDKHFIREILDGKKDVTLYDYSTTEKTPSWAGDATSMHQLFRGIIAGMKSVRVNVQTLRHTKTASRAYEFAGALSGVAAIYSSPALCRVEDVPSHIKNNMAPPPTVNPFTRTDSIVVFAGWEKHFPQIQISAAQKSQIVVEWEYGEWATITHPTYYA